MMWDSPRFWQGYLLLQIDVACIENIYQNIYINCFSMPTHAHTPTPTLKKTSIPLIYPSIPYPLLLDLKFGEVHLWTISEDVRQLVCSKHVYRCDIG